MWDAPIVFLLLVSIWEVDGVQCLCLPVSLLGVVARVLLFLQRRRDG